MTAPLPSEAPPDPAVVVVNPDQVVLRLEVLDAVTPDFLGAVVEGLLFYGPAPHEHAVDKDQDFSHKTSRKRVNGWTARSASVVSCPSALMQKGPSSISGRNLGVLIHQIKLFLYMSASMGLMADV